MQFFIDNFALLSIPLISAIVGWGTNFLAVKMMFYPIKFLGIPPFLGWQGIIPSKAREMAEIEVELVLGKLLSVKEIAGRLWFISIFSGFSGIRGPVSSDLVSTEIGDSGPIKNRLKIPMESKEHYGICCSFSLFSILSGLKIRES